VKNLLNFTLISSTILLTAIPNLSLAQSAEENIRETGVLKVAVRQDSPLFGFGNDYEGYCADLAKQLAAKLSQDYGKTIQVMFVKSTTQTRWDLVTNGNVHLECGPNSISEEKEKELKISFSSPFFYTATQIFTRAGIEEQALIDGSMGVVGNTSNEAELKTVYTLDRLNNSYTSRSHGVVDVVLGELTGFASDGILLIGTAATLGVDLNKYAIVTPLVDGRPFCAGYGMILPGGEENKNWHSTVNNFVTANLQGSKVWDTWFADAVPYIGAVLEACKTN
jgi:polar amino acid transport system substrate-binding protein